MVQLHQRPLLDTRYVRAGNAELLGDFPLRPLLPAVLETETADDDLLLAIVQNIQIFINFRFLDFQLHFVHDVVRFGAEDID